MDIEVMYGDLATIRVPIADANTLPKTGVLFSIYSAETTQAMSRRVIDGKHYRRCREWWGTDYTAVMRVGDDHLLWGWDEKDYAWVNGLDPFAPSKVRPPTHPGGSINLPPWMRSDAIIFEGVQLERAEWDTAVEKFNAEMH